MIDKKISHHSLGPFFCFEWPSVQGCIMFLWSVCIHWINCISFYSNMSAMLLHSRANWWLVWSSDHGEMGQPKKWVRFTDAHLPAAKGMSFYGGFGLSPWWACWGWQHCQPHSCCEEPLLAKSFHVLQHFWESDQPGLAPFPERLCKTFFFQQRHTRCSGDRHRTVGPQIWVWLVAGGYVATSSSSCVPKTSRLCPGWVHGCQQGHISVNLVEVQVEVPYLSYKSCSAR